jgi:hypothetical protein
VYHPYMHSIFLWIRQFHVGSYLDLLNLWDCFMQSRLSLLTMITEILHWYSCCSCSSERRTIEAGGQSWKRVRQIMTGSLHVYGDLSVKTVHYWIKWSWSDSPSTILALDPLFRAASRLLGIAFGFSNWVMNVTTLLNWTRREVNSDLKTLSVW